MLVLSLFHFFIQLLANKWKYKIFPEGFVNNNSNSYYLANIGDHYAIFDIKDDNNPIEIFENQFNDNIKKKYNFYKQIQQTQQTQHLLQNSLQGSIHLE